MSTVSTQTRRELAKAIKDRYLASSPSEKRRILDEFVALTGYHRKHAIRVLRSPVRDPISRPPRLRVYDEAVREALVVLWEASDRICGKRLKPLLPILIPALENHGRLVVDDTVRNRLLTVSAATIDRLLASKRAAAQGHPRERRARPHASQRVAVRTRASGDPPDPATFELDLAAVWHEAEVRPTHPAGPPPARHWRTRADPFDGVWPRVVTWLEARPDQTAKQLLQRLQGEGLGEFADRHLRTLQRRVKAWRRTIRPVRPLASRGSIPG